jgi:hypothetical protein
LLFLNCFQSQRSDIRAGNENEGAKEVKQTFKSFCGRAHDFTADEFFFISIIFSAFLKRNFWIFVTKN